MVSLVILSKNQITNLTNKFDLEKIWPILSKINPLTSAKPRGMKKKKKLFRVIKNRMTNSFPFLREGARGILIRKYSVCPNWFEIGWTERWPDCKIFSSLSEDTSYYFNELSAELFFYLLFRTYSHAIIVIIHFNRKRQRSFSLSRNKQIKWKPSSGRSQENEML